MDNNMEPAVLFPRVNNGKRNGSYLETLPHCSFPMQANLNLDVRIFWFLVLGTFKWYP